MTRTTYILAILLDLTVLCAHADTPKEAFEIKTVGEAYRLTDDACKDPLPFTFTGVLLNSGPEYSRIRDDTGSAPLRLSGVSTDAIPNYSTIRVKGKMRIVRNGEREFVTTDCEMLHQNEPESPVVCTCADILGEKISHHRVRVCGVISSVTLDEVDPRAIWASLRDGTGSIYLTFTSNQFDRESLQELVDAEVEITGMAMQLGGLRHNLGQSISVDEPGNIRILKPASKNPFNAPIFTSLKVPHRQRINGTVVGIARDRFFIRTPASQVISVIPVTGTSGLKPGMKVCAAGFATLDPYQTMFLEAIVRIDSGTATLDEKAEETSLESLFKDASDQAKISMDINKDFLSLKGVTTRVDEDTLLLSSGSYSIFIDLTVFGDETGSIPPNGSTIAAKGLCVATFEGDSGSAIFPKFRHFTLYPSSPGDIRILSKASWWTPLKLLCIIGTLTVIIVAILIRNRIITVVSERRGRELYEEKIGHALAEQKVEERTRLAVELHDSLSQTLTGISLLLDSGEIETAKTMMTSCRGELRRCLWDLRSRTFEEKDLTEAILRTITPHLNGCEASVRFNVPCEKLSEPLTHAILRIVRELVVNAVLHGRARHIRIAGESHDSVVSFSVADDGTGFDPATAPGPQQGHFGLLGIAERVENFNGTFKMESAPGKGAKFTVTLTASDEPDEN